MKRMEDAKGDWVELLKVEDTYWISKTSPSMLVLRPHVTSNKKTPFRKPFEVDVMLVFANGSEVKARAVIATTHLNIRGTAASLEERWPTTVLFTDKKPQDVPIGTLVLVRSAILKKIWAEPNSRM